MAFVLLDTENTVLKYSSEYAAFDPTVPVKPGHRWLPIETVVTYVENPLLVAQTTVVVEENRYLRRVDGVRRPEAEQKAIVKAEARRRILDRYPDWKQTNMLARSVELVKKGASLTPEETVESQQLEAVWAWIKAVRAASDQLEAMTPIPLDFEDNGRWPA